MSDIIPGCRERTKFSDFRNNLSSTLFFCKIRLGPRGSRGNTQVHKASTMTVLKNLIEKH